jgi:hypothetical protein
MDIDSHLNTCVGTQSPKYLEMAQRHISLSFPTSQDAQNRHLLVLTHVFPLEVYEGSSSQHVLDDDVTASPYRS